MTAAGGKKEFHREDGKSAKKEIVSLGFLGASGTGVLPVFFCVGFGERANQEIGVPRRGLFFDLASRVLVRTGDGVGSTGGLRFQSTW